MRGSYIEGSYSYLLIYCFYIVRVCVVYCVSLVSL